MKQIAEGLEIELRIYKNIEKKSELFPGHEPRPRQQSLESPSTSGLFFFFLFPPAYCPPGIENLLPYVKESKVYEERKKVREEELIVKVKKGLTTFNKRSAIIKTVVPTIFLGKGWRGDGGVQG